MIPLRIGCWLGILGPSCPGVAMLGNAVMSCEVYGACKVEMPRLESPARLNIRQGSKIICLFTLMTLIVMCLRD